MDKIIITTFGLLLVVFIYWLFFGKKEEIEKVTGKAEIIVEGGYHPDTLSIPLNKATTIVLNRKDPSSCLEEIVIPDFKIRKYLPLNQKTEIVLTPKKTGTFPFSCGMHMYHGKIIVS